MTDKQKKEAEAKITAKAEKDKAKARKEGNKLLVAQFRIEQALNIQKAMMNTATALTKATAEGGFFGSPFMIGVLKAIGVAQVALIASQKPPKMARGGMIGGRRHAQGGTMIEAEQGEFVMSRNAVSSIGASALNQMNQSGGAGLTLNISAPLVDETVLDTIIPAIQKAQRMNLA